jgi:predicted acyltransferase (DUF342 family)
MNQSSTNVFEGPVNGPIHTGQGNIIDSSTHVSYTGRYDVEPGETRTQSVFHTRLSNFDDPILIGRGFPKKPTTVKGDIAGWEVRLGNFTHVIGDVYGLTSVSIDSRCLIEGNVIGDNVHLSSECFVTRSIFANHISLGSDSKIQGHVFCDHLISNTPTTPTAQIAGLLICGHGLEVPAQTRFSRLICLGDIQIGTGAVCLTLISTGTVTLLEGSTALVVKCKDLVVKRGAKVGTALVSHSADIGAESEVGFIEAGGISKIGRAALLRQTTLVSSQVRTKVDEQFWLGSRNQTSVDGFSLHNDGTLTLDPDSAVGTLFTQLLSQDCIRIGARLTRERLIIAA